MKFSNTDLKVNQIITFTFVCLILLSITATWYNTMVLRNFVIIDDLEDEEIIEENN